MNGGESGAVDFVPPDRYTIYEIYEKGVQQMDSYSIKRQIWDVESQISDAVRARKELEERQNALMDFAWKCEQKAESFLASVDRRRTKLNGLTGFLNSIRTAAAYSDRMNDLLSGESYRSAKRSVDELMENIDRQKRDVERDLEDIEGEIRYLRRRLDDLEYEYRNCLREEQNG